MTSLMKTRAKAMNNCVKPTRKAILVLKGKKEEKSQITLKNKERTLLLVVKLDGCYAQGTTEKCCDYMVQYKGINYYIELKGVDYERAFLQIISAITQFNKDFKSNTCKAIIVTTRSPTSPAFNKAFKRSGLWRYICGEVIKRSARRPYILS